MSLDRPFVLLALAALLPLSFLAALRFKRRSDAFFQLAGRRAGGGSIAEAELRARSNLSTLFFMLSMACAVLALAGPRWGSRLIPEYRRGLDVVLAMDASRSMDARDVPPSRLRRAAAIARSFVEASAGTRFAVVLGKGDGVLAVPLTDDAESVTALLAAFSSETMSSRGTDLERLTDAAVRAFPASSSARRLVVVFSDGESLSGDLAAAAARAEAAGVLVAAVGIGTEAGAPVPASPGSATFLKDGGGDPIRTSLRQEELRKLARGSAERYFDGVRGDASGTLSRLAAELSSASVADGFRRESVPRYRLFLAAALLFFAASKLAESVPRRRDA